MPREKVTTLKVALKQEPQYEVMKYGTIIRREAGHVIVARPGEPFLPYVVWREDVREKEKLYFSGTYCATLREACEAFESRSGVQA